MDAQEGQTVWWYSNIDHYPYPDSLKSATVSKIRKDGRIVVPFLSGPATEHLHPDRIYLSKEAAIDAGISRLRAQIKAIESRIHKLEQMKEEE